MSKRTQYAQRPRCPCRQAIEDAYQAKVEASTYPYPKRPEDTEGYCPDCFTRLWAAAEWPADVWEYLHYSAANSYHPTKPLKPYKLPPAPKPRREALAKLLVRSTAKYTLTKQERDSGTTDAARCDSAVGTGCGGGWYVAATSGHCAIVRRGPGTKGARFARILPDQDGAWIDLSEAFYFALQRVRLLSNERSEAVRLTSYPDGTVHLYARCPEYGEAWETVSPVRTSGGELPVYETCLNASYLDATLGSWPLRWYLRPPEQKDRPAGKYERGDEDGRVRWIEELPQVFEPAGAEWRAVIMPMRI